MSSSDDEDLKLAIARSLAETTIRQPSNKDNPILVSSDDDEPRPPTHVTPHTETPSSKSVKSMNIAASAGISTLAVTTDNTFLSERAQLEAARLARLKRMRESDKNEESAPKVKSKPSLDDPFVSEDEDEVQRPPAKRSKHSAYGTAKDRADKLSSSVYKKSMPPTAQPTASGSRLAAAANMNHVETSAENNLFWTGELRQTANIHVDRERDARPVFRLHDILGNKSELTFIVLSSFVTQLSWIYSLLPLGVPVLLVAQPDAKGSATVHNMLPNWVKVTPELRGGRGCMHMKFMLLFYKSGRLRLVISTANLVDYDWRDIENSVWLQDIPKRPGAISRDLKVDDFPAAFGRVLDALGAREGLRALRQDHPSIPLRSTSDLACGWDFSKVRAQLVPSLAGRHEGWPSVLQVGHVRLMRVVRHIGARADALESRGKGKGKGPCPGERELEIECQGSSIGTYTPAWIDEFLCSARGASPEAWLDMVKTKRVKDLDGRLARDGWTSWSNLKILFPSLQTVKMSHLGEDGAGTMFCQRRQWEGPKFPRQLFYDSNSKRGRVLMHSKMILATLEVASPGNLSIGVKRTNGNAKAKSADPDSSATESSSDSEVEEIDPERDANVVGWLYVGSHNFTPSAWGTLSGSRFTPVMNITNFELGVVLPLYDHKQADELVCWSRPPRKYNLGKDQPWIQNFTKG